MIFKKAVAKLPKSAGVDLDQISAGSLNMPNSFLAGVGALKIDLHIYKQASSSRYQKIFWHVLGCIYEDKAYDTFGVNRSSFTDRN